MTAEEQKMNPEELVRRKYPHARVEYDDQEEGGPEAQIWLIKPRISCQCSDCVRSGRPVLVDPSILLAEGHTPEDAWKNTAMKLNLMK